MKLASIPPGHRVHGHGCERDPLAGRVLHEMDEVEVVPLDASNGRSYVYRDLTLLSGNYRKHSESRVSCV